MYCMQRRVCVQMGSYFQEIISLVYKRRLCSHIPLTPLVFAARKESERCDGKTSSFCAYLVSQGRGGLE